MECPNDETLLSLVEGRLRGDALAAVDSHLDACDPCRELVATLASGPRAVQTQAETRASRADAIGRFLVIDKIGEGAMGEVYSAYDPELDRRVALKLLHAEPGPEKARARLMREAQAMARLSHPHVVTVFDVGVRGDDVYVAMELVDGRSLREWLADERGTQEILSVFTQAAEGLAAAHDAGLVHRDFKPENVLVDRAGRAKVGDFGLAVGVDEGGGELPDGALLAATLTRTGALLGTPAYMAPEQLAGEGADARADQFAFCVALWEALSGERPFASATSVAALREAIAAGPPSPRFHRRIGAVLARGLSASPDARFPDMRALLAALSPTARARSPFVAVGLASAIAIGVAIVARVSPTSDPCEASRRALDATGPVGEGLEVYARVALDRWSTSWIAQRVDACEDTRVRREQSDAQMDRRMACLDRQRLAFGAVVDRLDEDVGGPFVPQVLATLPDPASCASVSDGVAPPGVSIADEVTRVRGEIDVARVQIAAAEHEDALRAAARIVASSERLGYGPLTSEAHRLEAEALRALARYDEALAAANEAVLAAEASSDDRAAAEAWLALAKAAGAGGRYADAADHAAHAEATIARLGEPADLREELLRLRGVLRTNLGDLVGAERDLRAALESSVAQHGAASPQLAPIHTSLGNLLRVDSRLDEALLEHRRALAIDRAALGDAHPRVARDLHNLGGILRRLGRTDEARASYEEARRIAIAVYGDSHPEVALTRNSLGLLAHARGDRREARAQWDAAVAIFDAHGHGDAALSRHNLALLDLDEERYEEARANVVRAIAIDAERIGPRSKRVGSEHVVLARALRGLGRAQEANDAAHTALSIAQEMNDPPLAADARALLDPEGEAADTGTSSRRSRAQQNVRIFRSRVANETDPEVAQAPTVAEPRSEPVRSEALGSDALGSEALGSDALGSDALGSEAPRRPNGSGAYGAGQAWE
jgi:tetratricopeptide (TPR) repeat protein